MSLNPNHIDLLLILILTYIFLQVILKTINNIIILLLLLSKTIKYLKYEEKKTI